MKKFKQFVEEGEGGPAPAGDAPQANNTSNIGGGYPGPFISKKAQKRWTSQNKMFRRKKV